jgi:hypothetical protein
MLDITIDDCGSVTMLTPMTEQGREWIGANLDADSWQWLGGSLAVEPSMVPALLEAMIDDGLEVGATE